MSERNETTARGIFALMLDLAREIRCCSRDEAFCGNLTFQQFVILDAVARAVDQGRFNAVDKKIDKKPEVKDDKPIIRKADKKADTAK